MCYVLLPTDYSSMFLLFWSQDVEFTYALLFDLLKLFSESHFPFLFFLFGVYLIYLVI